MSYVTRLIEDKVRRTLDRGKSVLLLGARQTGKTTLLEKLNVSDMALSFLDPEVRIRFETSPSALTREIAALRLRQPTLKKPLITIDEVQKIPAIMDEVQFLIDKKEAQFILTGSSARKLKHNKEINLLPGRVVLLHLDALSLLEMPTPYPDIETLLLYGSLPEIILNPSNEEREDDLFSYVATYLEEEIRAEATVRNIGNFARFLEFAAVELATPINFSKLSSDVGITRNTLQEYYQILEDCLIADRIQPVSSSTTRRKLTKAPKYLFFDLGVRRACAKEGVRVSEKFLGILFEQFVGMELLKIMRYRHPSFRLRYWRDHAGPEIDYVIEMDHKYLPIEAKWTTLPTQKDCRHLEKFLDEYPIYQGKAYVVCRTPRAMMLSERIMAIPWQEMPSILDI